MLPLLFCHPSVPFFPLLTTSSSSQVATEIFRTTFLFHNKSLGRAWKDCVRSWPPTTTTTRRALMMTATCFLLKCFGSLSPGYAIYAWKHPAFMAPRCLAVATTSTRLLRGRIPPLFPPLVISYRQMLLFTSEGPNLSCLDSIATLFQRLFGGLQKLLRIRYCGKRERWKTHFLWLESFFLENVFFQKKKKNSWTSVL